MAFHLRPMLAVLFAGVAFPIVWPPVQLELLNWVLWAPLMVVCSTTQPRRAALYGYASGVLFVGIGYRWLVETVVAFGNLPEVAGVGVLILFALAFALPLALAFGLLPWVRRRFGPGWIWLFGAIWVAIEQLPTLFPWQLGAVHNTALPVWQLASVTGVAGVSYLVVVVNAGLAEAWMSRRSGLPRRHLALLAGIVTAVLVGGTWRTAVLDEAQEAAPTLRVAQLQIDLSVLEQVSLGPTPRLTLWRELTARVTAKHPDLVIWSEGAMRTEVDDPKAVRKLGQRSAAEYLGAMAAEGGFHLLAGGLRSAKVDDGEGGTTRHRTNSAWSFSREGQLLDRTDKRLLLTFGERRPFADTMPAVADLFGPDHFDLTPGTRPVTVTAHLADGTPYTYSVPICYEAIFDATMWWLFEGEEPDPVDLFIVISNDSWFGDTASPHQHAMLTSRHAIQFGRPMVRAATTGVSWVVAPNGRISSQTSAFTELARVATAPLLAVETWYVRGGWIFRWLCVLVALLASIWGWRREP